MRIITITLSLLLPCVSISCPPNMVMELIRCMKQLQPVMGEEFDDVIEGIVPVLGNADPDLVERQCREGKYHEAVQCIEDAIKECQEDSLSKFSEIFDAKALRSMIGYYCNNTDTYRAASPCMKAHSREMQYCVRREIEIARTSNHISELCKAKVMGQNCVNGILKSECGEEIADLLQKTADAPLSPKCRSASNGESFPAESKVTVDVNEQTEVRPTQQVEGNILSTQEPVIDESPHSDSSFVRTVYRSRPIAPPLNFSPIVTSSFTGIYVLVTLYALW